MNELSTAIEDTIDKAMRSINKKYEYLARLKNYVRKGVEYGAFTSTEGFNKSIETIKSEYRRYNNDSNVLSGRRTSNTDDTVSSGITRQQSTNNATDNIAKGGRNEQLKNSEQSSFSLSKDNQNETLFNERQKYIFLNIL